MFKKFSAADEVFSNMQQIEQEKAVSENLSAETALVTAMEHLNAAAECFEMAGLVKQATDITQLMYVVTAGPKKKKAPKSKEEEKKVFKFFGFKNNFQKSKDKKKDDKKEDKKDDKKKKAGNRLAQLTALGQAVPWVDPNANQSKNPPNYNPQMTPATPLVPSVPKVPGLGWGLPKQQQPAAQKPAQTIAGPQGKPLTKDQVTAIQKTLTLTRDIKVDGVWGPESEDALKAFQSHKNIEPSGKIDAETLIALQDTSETTANDYYNTQMLATIDKNIQPGAARIRQKY